MNRDYGKSKLIPVKYTLEWCSGHQDKEFSRPLLDPYSKEYEDLLVMLPAYSNIRMYAWDKQGYANCIRASYVDAAGISTETTNRLAELNV